MPFIPSARDRSQNRRRPRAEPTALSELRITAPANSALGRCRNAGRVDAAVSALQSSTARAVLPLWRQRSSPLSECGSAGEERWRADGHSANPSEASRRDVVGHAQVPPRSYTEQLARAAVERVRGGRKISALMNSLRGRRVSLPTGSRTTSSIDEHFLIGCTGGRQSAPADTIFGLFARPRSCGRGGKRGLDTPPRLWLSSDCTERIGDWTSAITRRPACWESLHKGSYPTGRSLGSTPRLLAQR